MNQHSKILILDNIRSMHNVGSLFRTAAGCGINTIYCCGITPYPALKNDSRLPHIQQRATKHIAKTALGAESMLRIRHFDTTLKGVQSARKSGHMIIGIEQSTDSLAPKDMTLPQRWAVIAGAEVDGIDQDILTETDAITELAMPGQKKSFNVHTACAMVLYEFCIRNDS